MKAPLERLFADYERALRVQRFRAEDLDLGRLDYHLPLLERLDGVEDSSALGQGPKFDRAYRQGLAALGAAAEAAGKAAGEAER